MGVLQFLGRSLFTKHFDGNLIYRRIVLGQKSLPILGQLPLVFWRQGAFISLRTFPVFDFFPVPRFPPRGQFCDIFLVTINSENHEKRQDAACPLWESLPADIFRHSYRRRWLCVSDNPHYCQNFSLFVGFISVT